MLFLFRRINVCYFAWRLLWTRQTDKVTFREEYAISLYPDPEGDQFQEALKGEKAREHSVRVVQRDGQNLGRLVVLREKNQIGKITILLFENALIVGSQSRTQMLEKLTSFSYLHHKEYGVENNEGHDEVLEGRRLHDPPQSVFESHPLLGHVPLQRGGVDCKVDARFLLDVFKCKSQWFAP